MRQLKGVFPVSRIVRTEAEIEDQLALAREHRDKGSRYHGMCFEEGMDDMYRWLVGQSDDKPIGPRDRGFLNQIYCVSGNIPCR